MPSNSGGAHAHPIGDDAPQSPPCATNPCSQALIDPVHARVMWAGSTAALVGSPNPRSRHRRNHHVEGIRRAGAMRRRIGQRIDNLQPSMIEPGDPCVTISGNASSCFERTWMKMSVELYRTP